MVLCMIGQKGQYFLLCFLHTFRHNSSIWPQLSPTDSGIANHSVSTPQINTGCPPLTLQRLDFQENHKNSGKL